MTKPLVVLFHPRTLHEQNYRYYYIPYSLLSIAAPIPRERFDILLIDNNVHRVPDWQVALGDIVPRRPVCFAITSMIGAQIEEAIAFSAAAAEAFPGVPRVWGGALATVLPELTARHPAVDIALQGPGQESFPELLERLSQGADPAGTPGAAVAARDAVRKHPPPPLPDLNSLPPFSSTYDLVHLERYVRDDEHIAPRTTNYHSSQGCPFSCGFCSEVALWNRRWTAMDADRLFTDVTWLVEHHGVEGIKFYDAEFFIDRRRVLAFAQRVVDSGLPIRWAAAVHPRNVDRLSDEEFDLLARSGVARLLMGAESGVQEELDLIGKRTSRDLLLRTARRCSDRGVVASFSFVTGYPASPPDRIGASLEFARELLDAGPEHEAKVHFFAPYPGTPLYPLALEHGFEPPRTLEEWAAYDYYLITTPWVSQSWESEVRAFNQDAYPYLHARQEHDAGTRLCPILTG